MSLGTNVSNDQLYINVGNDPSVYAPLRIDHGYPSVSTAILIQGRQTGGRSDIIFRDHLGRDISKISSHNDLDPASDQNHGFQVYVRNAANNAWYSPFVIYTLRDTGTIDMSGQLIVSGLIRTDRLRLQSPTVPATSTSAGIKGEIGYDSNYAYICYATNQWARIPLDKEW